MILNMLKTVVLDYFKTPGAVAKALGINAAAVSQWDALIPPGSAYELSKLTNGALNFDPGLYQQSSPHRRRLAELLAASS